MQKKKQNWWTTTNDKVRKEVANIKKPRNNSHVANKWKEAKQGANIWHYNKLMMINEDKQDANKWKATRHMSYDEGVTKDVLKSKLICNNARYNVKLERKLHSWC